MRPKANAKLLYILMQRINILLEHRQIDHQEWRRKFRNGLSDKRLVIFERVVHLGLSSWLSFGVGMMKVLNVGRCGEVLGVTESQTSRQKVYRQADCETLELFEWFLNVYQWTMKWSLRIRNEAIASYPRRI